ncbi:MAG: hypothetical protein J6Y02_14680 [Pseudobutyrivibrio sp.]|nr:hypothetical protein [Pseudobutyrivibrio sp.]
MDKLKTDYEQVVSTDDRLFGDTGLILHSDKATAYVLHDLDSIFKIKTTFLFGPRLVYENNKLLERISYVVIVQKTDKITKTYTLERGTSAQIIDQALGVKLECRFDDEDIISFRSCSERLSIADFVLKDDIYTIYLVEIKKEPETPESKAEQLLEDIVNHKIVHFNSVIETAYWMFGTTLEPGNHGPDDMRVDMAYIVYKYPDEHESKYTTIARGESVLTRPDMEGPWAELINGKLVVNKYPIEIDSLLLFQIHDLEDM